MDIRREWDQEVVFYVGTRKLVGLVGRMRDGESSVVAYREVQNPDGFENGLVKNLEAASNSIEKLREELIPAKGSSGVSAYVVLGNARLRTFGYSSSQYFEAFPRQITTAEIRSVIHQTKSVATLPLSELVLQVLPESFIVNDMSGIRDPIGLEAHRLGVSLRIFTMNFEDFKNIERAFEVADVETKGFYPKTLTSSEAVLTEPEKNEGTLLIDIADDVTMLSGWKNGAMIGTDVFGEGGRHISARLADLWKIEFHDAERVKERYATLDPRSEFGEELIPLVTRGTREGTHVNRNEFHEKYLREAQAWLGRIVQKAEEFSAEHKLYQPHYVLTGGGSSTPGMLEFLQQHFGLDARLGCTRGIEAPNELRADPSSVAALGMIVWLATNFNDYARLVQPQGFFERTLTSAKDWFCTYF